MPAWVLELPESDRRLMIMHEQEHLRGRDSRLVLFARGACVLHRLRGSIELDCDARVLARAGDPAASGMLPTRWSLTLGLADDPLAVAYRSPAITPAVAGRIVQFAISQVGRPYSTGGALLSTDKMRCKVLKPTPGTFFCSQLVAEAYRRGGLALTQLPSQCVIPDDTVVIAGQQLRYGGHLRGNPFWFPKPSP